MSFVAYVTLSVNGDSKPRQAETIAIVDSPQPTQKQPYDSPPYCPRKPHKGHHGSILPQHLDIIRRTLSELDQSEKEHALDHLPTRMLERLLASIFSCHGDVSTDPVLGELLVQVPGLTHQVHALLHDNFPDLTRNYDEMEDFVANAANDPVEILHLSEQLAGARPFVDGLSPRNLEF